jgi:hypothetical protein
MSDNPDQQGCAVSRSIDQEITAMRQEIKDLEKAIARQDPPLTSYTRAIAEAKIGRLQSQIAALCELFGEILTDQRRPLAWGSGHMTSMEEWTARLRLGLWTR